MIDDLKPYPAMKDSGVPWLGDLSGGVKTGSEIRFTSCFARRIQLRTLKEIRADTLALEKETERLLDEIIAGAKA